MEISADTDLISSLENINIIMDFKIAQSQSGDNHLVFLHTILTTAHVQSWVSHLLSDIGK